MNYRLFGILPFAAFLAILFSNESLIYTAFSFLFPEHDSRFIAVYVLAFLLTYGIFRLIGKIAGSKESDEPPSITTQPLIVTSVGYCILALSISSVADDLWGYDRRSIADSFETDMYWIILKCIFSIIGLSLFLRPWQWQRWIWKIRDKAISHSPE